MGGAARRHHPPLRPLPAPQRGARPRQHAGGTGLPRRRRLRRLARNRGTLPNSFARLARNKKAGHCSRLGAREATHVALTQSASARDDDCRLHCCWRLRFPQKSSPNRAVNVGANDIGGVVTSAKGPRSRRLGDRGDHRTADQVRADRRHRRSGPLSHPRSSEGQLQRLGARLWPRRFSQGATAKPGKQLNLTAVIAPNDGRGGALLSGDLLVRDDEDSARERVRRQERHSGKDHAERLAASR